jgi:hypothetical protein
MKKYGAIYRSIILVLLLILCCSAMVSSLPLYGGEKHHYDKSAVAQEFKPKQVQLATGTAECVRTAWIGDINNRTVICVEWRTVKKDSK